MKITVSASDIESGIAQIQISVAGSVVKTCINAASCQYNWPVSGVSPGSYVVTASAIDKDPVPHSSSVSITLQK